MNMYNLYIVASEDKILGITESEKVAETFYMRRSLATEILVVTKKKIVKLLMQQEGLSFIEYNDIVEDYFTLRELAENKQIFEFIQTEYIRILETIKNLKIIQGYFIPDDEKKTNKNIVKDLKKLLKSDRLTNAIGSDLYLNNIKTNTPIGYYLKESDDFYVSKSTSD